MHEGNLYSLMEGENTAKITSYNPCIKTMVTKPCNNIITTSSSMAVVVFIVFSSIYNTCVDTVYARVGDRSPVARSIY